MNPPDPLARLAARFGLDGAQADRLDRLLALVAGDDAAPTTVRERARVLDDHLADALVALELAQIPWAGSERTAPHDLDRPATRIADLGAGAGFPGLPLAIALPYATVSLVESNARKCVFLERARDACTLDNAVVVRERAELWREGLEACEVVTARALAALPVVAEYAAPLLTVGGALVAWRGRRDRADELAASRASAELGLEPRAPVAVTPYPGALHRHLHVFDKVSPTPARFPRRPGVARKHPLGA